MSFYIGDTIYYKEDRDLRIKESMLSLMTLLMILKVSIQTRINGFTTLGKKNISMIPIGGKGISSNEEMLIETFSSLIRNIKKEINKNPSNMKLREVCDSFMQIFGSIKVETDNSIFKTEIKDIAEDFHEKWADGIDKLLQFDPFKDIVVVGDLAIFHARNNMRSSTSLIRELVDKEIENNNTLKILFAKSKSDMSLPDAIRNEMNTAANALQYFISNNEETSMNLIDNTNSIDRFVAIPLVAPFILRSLESYVEEEYTESLKDCMEAYLKAYYSIGNTLPITSNFSGIPFITFKSNSLLNIRKKIFSGQYVFCSSEINLLNLMLLE